MVPQVNERCTLMFHRTPRGYLLRVAGRGTMRESPTVRNFVRGALEEKVEVVADLSACDYLDSTFLGCLVTLHKHGRINLGSFAVHADESARQRLFGPLGLHRVLDFVDECPHCIGPSVTLGLAEIERQEFSRHVSEAHRKLAELGGPGAETFRGIADRLSRELNDSGSTGGGG